MVRNGALKQYGNDDLFSPFLSVLSAMSILTLH